MAVGMKNLSKTFVWIILGLLIVGLAGFGATNLSGTVRTVGLVGTQIITVDEYARELQREMQAIQAQTGQLITPSQAQALGLDQAVLSRLVSLASLDNEVAELGLSIGDKNLQEEIVAIPAFQGIDGQFSREAYQFALNQTGMNDSEFETDLREEAARTLVQGAVIAGVRMPAVMTDTLANYVGERRSFTFARLDGSLLDAPLPDPTEAELQAFYDANGADFTLPETKRLSYALLTPDMILDQVDVEESALRDLYEEHGERYNQPERRLVERLVFADQAAAESAKAQLDVNGTSFELLVEDRGLQLADIDLGDVTQSDLGEAADDIFAAEVGDILGPLPSSLGPALFRVNGVLAARSTSFEDAEPELRSEIAADRARRLVEAQAQNIDDLLAGGATLAELEADSDMTVGSIDWTVNSSDGVAAYDAFRSVASTVTAEDYPEVAFLDDGGIFALELTELLPPRPEPFEDARDRVIAGWTLAQTEIALREKADAVIIDLATTGDFTETGLPVRVENGLTRTAYIDGSPADFMNQVFEMDPDELRIISGPGTVFIVKLDEVLGPQDTPELAAMRDAYNDQLSQSLSQALFTAYVADAQQRARPRLDERALQAVNASFH